MELINCRFNLVVTIHTTQHLSLLAIRQTQ
jgi:hypothetical protein